MARKLLQTLHNFSSKIYKMPPQINYRSTKAVMKEVELYQNNNMVTRRDSSEFLEEYSSKMYWTKENAKILDVGCADGGVTIQVLKPYLPLNFGKLVGCDISEEMVAYAKQHYEKDRIEFMVMDITGDPTPFVETFDQIFSFYTLHWVQEQEKALSNIYSILVPGGDCLLLFLCFNPIFNVYRIMADSPIWSQYMFDVENSISPYHDSQNPEEEYSNLMIKCGFKNVEVQCKSKCFTYKDFDTVKNLFRSVNPIIHRLSPALKEQFMEDFMQKLMKENGISKMSNKNVEREEIKISYTLLLAHASK